MKVSSRMEYVEVYNALSEMGYYCLSAPTEGYPLAAITEYSEDMHILTYTTLNAVISPNFYFIPDYNPDLFKAIAAMSDEGKFFPGEWVVALKDLSGTGSIGEGCFYKIQSTSTENGLQIEDDWVRGTNEKGGWAHRSNFRKATLENLVSHFTQPTPKVEKEWEPVNGELIAVSDGSIKGIFIGMDESLFVVREDDDDESCYTSWSTAMPVKSQPITLTRQEAETRLTEIEGKTVLIKD